MLLPLKSNSSSSQVSTASSVLRPCPRCFLLLSASARLIQWNPCHIWKIREVEEMPSQRDFFPVSGPTFLTSVNWNCPKDQRSVAASLVQGAYVFERDRQQSRKGLEAFAPAWHEHFHFTGKSSL